MFQDAAAVNEYALAGRAVLTLTSEVTGARYTFRISQPKDNDKMWFVGLLTGPDNMSDYSYLGLIGDNGFRLTAKSKFAPDSLPARGFAFFWKHIAAGQMPAQMQIRHEGHCGRCGRALTVPESIDAGIGPECARQMGA